MFLTSSPLGNQSWGIASLQNPGKLLRASELAIFLLGLWYLERYQYVSRLHGITSAWPLIILHSDDLPQSKVSTKPKRPLVHKLLLCTFEGTLTKSLEWLEYLPWCPAVLESHLRPGLRESWSCCSTTVWIVTQPLNVDHTMVHVKIMKDRRSCARDPE